MGYEWIASHSTSMKKYNSLLKAMVALGNHPFVASFAGLKITNNLCLFLGHSNIVKNIGFSGFSVPSFVEERDSRYIDEVESIDRAAKGVKKQLDVLNNFFPCCNMFLS